MKKRFKKGDKVLMIAYPTDNAGREYPEESCCIGKIVTITDKLSKDGSSFDYIISCDRRKRSGIKHGCLDRQLAPVSDMSKLIYLD